ncbi:uncharacterized protein TNCV_2679191 [Trichonephila clavipes]|nr:uncharacterized protein TNCV_2679191 [Trichonephila clavipes]
MEIRTGSSDSNSSRHNSSRFESVQRRSNESQYGRKKGSDVKRELEEKGISFLRKVRMRDTPGPRKRCRGDEIVMPSASIYNLRPRKGTNVESRLTSEMKTQQGGPVRARESQEKHYSPTSKSRQQEYQKKRYTGVQKLRTRRFFQYNFVQKLSKSTHLIP